MKKLLLLGCIALAACATGEAAVELSYSTALTGADAYVNLQACSDTVTTLCSKTEVVTMIKDAKATADKALAAARTAETDTSVESAQKAVDVLSAIVNMPEVQSAIGE